MTSCTARSLNDNLQYAYDNAINVAECQWRPRVVLWSASLVYRLTSLRTTDVSKVADISGSQLILFEETGEGARLRAPFPQFERHKSDGP